MEVSKTSDFGSYPNGSVIALWCNGNMSDSDPEIAGSNPVRAALGHSYNGYYSGLLIRQIRVRSLRSTPVGAEPTSTRTSCAPGGPLKIWLCRLNRSGRWSRLPARSLLNACQRARSNLSRQKCRVQSLRSTPVGAEPTSTRTSCAPSELLITPHLTKQVQVATLSMWRYGFKSRWGDHWLTALSIMKYRIHNRW